MLFGLDESGKPKAALFSEAQADLALKAAAQLKLQVLTVNDPTRRPNWRRGCRVAACMPTAKASSRLFVAISMANCWRPADRPSDQQSAPNNGGADQPPGAKPTGKRP